MRNVLTIFCMFAVLVLGVYLSNQKNGIIVGSIAEGQGYMSTTTTANTGSFGTSIAFTKVLKNGPGTLGSIVITTSTAGELELFDGTTTQSHANHPTTTLAKIGPSLAAGTYTFDSTFARGLILVSPTGNLASTTITWR